MFPRQRNAIFFLKRNLPILRNLTLCPLTTQTRERIIGYRVRLMYAPQYSLYEVFTEQHNSQL